MPVSRIPVADISVKVDRPVDVLICCGSFEDRCLSVPLSFPATQVNHAIICEHENLHRYVGPNTEKLRSHYARKATHVELDSASPVRTADRLLAALKGTVCSSGRLILVDVTTFTHESLLILMGILPHIASESDDVHFAYTIAQEYCPGAPDDEKWLSKGIENIRSVLGFAGEILPGRGVHLVLLHGFEAERSKSLIKSYEPDLLSLGRPAKASATSDKHIVRNLRVHEQVMEFARNTVDVEELPFEANEPHSCRDSVLDRARIRGDLSVVVAPMNTKLSALGVGLAGRSNRAIRICYAQPSTYNFGNYSLAGKWCYLFQLDELFGAVAPS